MSSQCSVHHSYGGRQKTALNQRNCCKIPGNLLIFVLGTLVDGEQKTNFEPIQANLVTLGGKKKQPSAVARIRGNPTLEIAIMRGENQS
jgi:hypothetical protein